MKKPCNTALGIVLSNICFLLCLLSCGNKGSEDASSPEVGPVRFGEEYFDKLSEGLSNNVLYSKAVYLIRNSIIQSFDITKDGTIYYVQIAGTDMHQLNVVRAQPNQPPTDYMVLQYFGHGTNMAIEERGGETYIWMGSHGNKEEDGGYGGSQTISRVKYEPNDIVKHAGEEVFRFAETRNIHPAINVEKDLLGIQYSKYVSGVLTRCFAVYKLSEALALPETEEKLQRLTYGGEYGTPQKSVEMVVNVRELSTLKPLYQCSVSDGHGGIVGELPFQGYDVTDQFVYYYEGEGNDNKIYSTSKAYVSILDKDGRLAGRKAVSAITDIQKLKEYGIADRGYMEAEGIKIKGDVLYIGFASRLMNGMRDDRRANIFRYTND